MAIHELTKDSLNTNKFKAETNAVISTLTPLKDFEKVEDALPSKADF